MNTPKHLFLVLAHNPIPHIFLYAQRHPDWCFVVHIDKRANAAKIATQTLANVKFIHNNQRVAVTWAGFSMVQATLALMHAALPLAQNTTLLHLMSGEDVILDGLIRQAPDLNHIYMECRQSPRHRYRVRFNTWHADTQYQRKPYGKASTLALKILDRLLPSNQICWFGSQWFSLAKPQLIRLLEHIQPATLRFYQHKLCPDEHFFQYLLLDSQLFDHLSPLGNQRYIVFDKHHQHGSSPIYLPASDIMQINQEGYWFARKATPDTIQNVMAQQKLI